MSSRVTPKYDSDEEIDEMLRMNHPDQLQAKMAASLRNHHLRMLKLAEEGIKDFSDDQETKKFYEKLYARAAQKLRQY